MDILGLGDNVCDIYLHERMMYPGGQALNVAVNARRRGASSAYVGCFGCDAVADHIKKILDIEKVDRSHSITYEGENGFARVTLENGDRIFRGSNKGGVLREHPLAIKGNLFDYCSTFKIIHTSNNSYIDHELEVMRSTGSVISYDLSLSWKNNGTIERICPWADIVFLSGDGADARSVENLGKRIESLGPIIVVITRGSEGASVFCGDLVYHQKSQFVEPVDTMGAGDSFAASILVGLLPFISDITHEFNMEAVRDNLPAIMMRASFDSAQTCLLRGGLGHGTRVPDEIWAVASKEIIH